MFGWFKKRKLQRDVRSAFEDGLIDPNEIKGLRSRSKELGLEAADLQTAVAKLFENEIAPIRHRIEASRGFSPDDEAHISDAATRCAID